MKFCASSGGGEELEAAFTSLSINGRDRTDPPLPDVGPPVPPRPSETDRPTDLPHILIAMRKLREGILGSRRHDSFAQRAYMFIIQASILTRQWESYQAPLLHLLHGIHPHTPLSRSELRDFVGYRILDLACRQNDLVEAYAVQQSFKQNDRRTAAVLKALVHDDWPKFWRIRRAVDGYQRALMEPAEERVRMHALKCLGRGYMSADKAFVERSADARWEVMVRNGVGWQLQENGTVVIRKPKPK